MTVELTKVVDAVPRQRAWYTITALLDGWTHVEIILQRDDASGDDTSSALFLCEDDAQAYVYRTCVRHFGRFTDAELSGAQLTWEFAAFQNTPQRCLDLAAEIAEAICDRLAEESGMQGSLPATIQPIRWCEQTTQIWERSA